VPNLTLSVIALLVATPLVASAQTENHAAAEALFDEARRLVKVGDHAAACPKFAESQRLDAGVGTLLHLADCYEKVGKTASAWAAFREAQSAARQANQPDRARSAEEHASKLEARLSRLVIRFSATPGLVVKRGGLSLAAAASGVPFPVDPGQQEVTAEAPGKKRWSAVLEIKGPGDTSVVIPELETEAPVPTPVAPTASVAPSAPLPLESAPPPAAAAGGPAAGPWRAVGLVGVGAGAISLGIGAFVGLKARSTYDERRGYCTGNQCDSRGLELIKDARSQANLSTLLVGAGLVLGGAGAALLVWGRPQHETTLAPTVGPANLGLAVRGTL
jgi:hypothetical protein